MKEAEHTVGQAETEAEVEVEVEMAGGRPRSLLGAWCWCSGIIIDLQIMDLSKSKGDAVIQDINVIVTLPQEFTSLMNAHYVALDDEAVQSPANLGARVSMTPYLKRHHAAGSAGAAYFAAQQQQKNADDDTVLFSGCSRSARPAGVLVQLVQVAVVAAAMILLSN